MIASAHIQRGLRFGAARYFRYWPNADTRDGGRDVRFLGQSRPTPDGSARSAS